MCGYRRFKAAWAMAFCPKRNSQLFGVRRLAAALLPANRARSESGSKLPHSKLAAIILCPSDNNPTLTHKKCRGTIKERLAGTHQATAPVSPARQKSEQGDRTSRPGFLGSFRCATLWANRPCCAQTPIAPQPTCQRLTTEDHTGQNQRPFWPFPCLKTSCAL